MPRTIWLIVNPAAGGGRSSRLLPTVRRAFDGVGVHQVVETRAPGDEAACVARALDGGADTIAILGGDGTWSKATGALLASGAGRRCRVALLAGGTGNDFAAALGLPARAWVTMARLAAEGGDVTMDCARVDGRHVLNVAGMGFDVAVLEALRRGGVLRGAMMYRLAALRQIFRYRAMSCDPGDGDGMRPMLLLAIANGTRFGGGMIIAPAARTTDGLLDIVAIEDAPALRRLALFQAVGRGRHLTMPEVFVTRTRALTLHFADTPVFQADGELHLATGPELRVECVPGALRVVTPASSSAMPARSG